MNPILAAEKQTISNIGQHLTDFSIKSVYQFFPEVWQILLVAAVILAFILLLIGGIQWITSAGDKEAVTTARGKITAALIGLMIVFSAWAISGLLRGFFRFPSVLQIPGGACTYCEHCEGSSQKTHQCHGTIQDGVCKYDPKVDPDCTPCKRCGDGTCSICEGPDWCPEDCH